jgi:glutathione S-transferase
MTPVTLYSDVFWISPYVFACAVALREKGIRFDVKEIRLQDGEQRAGDYRARTRTGRVPALAHGDFVLTESSAILEYLEEAFPAPEHARIFPDSVTDRARARQLMSWLRSDETSHVRKERSAEVIFYPLPRAPLTAEGKAAATKAIEVARTFVGSAEGSMFGEWSIVDAELAFFLHRLWEDDLLPDDLRRYAAREWERPTVVEQVKHPRASFTPYT